MSPQREAVLYWRPGCGYCHDLRRQLDHAGIERREVNIWKDAAAAAVVRSHARGDETVPTVVIGDLGLVNPTAKEVIAALGSPDAGTSKGAGGHPDAAPVRETFRDAARGLTWGLVATGVWIVLALTSPTTTYHFAPLVTAVAWPVAARIGTTRARWAPGLLAAAGSAALIVIATAVLAASDSLAGPALVGDSALSETAIMGGLGLAMALGFARPTRSAAVAESGPRSVVGSGGGCTTLPDGSEHCEL